MTSDNKDHEGIGHEYEFGDVKAVVKPLGTRVYPDVMRVMASMSKLQGKKGVKDIDVFNTIVENDESLKAITRLVDITLKEQIMPGADEDERNQFAMQNMFTLINAVNTENMPKAKKESLDKMSKMQRFREMRNNESAAKNTSE